MNPEIKSQLEASFQAYKLNPISPDAAYYITKKNNVITAWRNWEGGALLDDDDILNLFTDFVKRASGDDTLPVFTSQTLESYLTNSDSWFEMIFIKDLTP